MLDSGGVRAAIIRKVTKNLGYYIGTVALATTWTIFSDFFRTQAPNAVIVQRNIRAVYQWSGEVATWGLALMRS